MQLVSCLKLGLLALLALVLSLTGCASQPVQQAKAPSSVYLTIQDDAGRQVVLPKKPERIVPLAVSYVDLVYAVGGKAVGKPSARTGNLPPEAQALPEVGHLANINAEQVVALQPDLVIGYQGLHEKLIPILESSNIPFIIVRMKTYEDVMAKTKLFGDIAGTPEAAHKVAANIDGRIKAVTDMLPSVSKQVVILHATASSVSVQLESSIAGNAASMLSLQNIAAGSTAKADDPDATPYSMEKLVEGNPDVILITFMGAMPEIRKRLQADMQSNPAWNGLKAVQNKQVFFLPMELFLLNPGIHFDEAVAYLSRVVYPEIYGEVQ